MSDELQPRVVEGEVIEPSPATTFTARDVIRLYRIEHASRLQLMCIRERRCVACQRADVLLARKE